MDVNTLLLGAGITPASLSPQVRTALEEVLRSAGLTAYDQVRRLLLAEIDRQKTASGSAPPTPAQQQAAVEAALAEQVRLDKIARDKAAQGRLYRLAGGIASALLLVVGILFYVKSRAHGQQNSPQ